MINDLADKLKAALLGPSEHLNTTKKLKLNMVTMTGTYIKENNFLYELNEAGEKVLVRSSESERRAYIRFTNKTSRPVDVWWRDFQGKTHHYVYLEPRAFSDINTFISHPWEFTDKATGENYVVCNNLIFRPPPNLANMRFRTNWNITVRVRTLRQTAMLAIADKISSSHLVERLDLPKTIEEDLKQVVKDLRFEQEIMGGEEREI